MIPYIDLKTQYVNLAAEIQQRINTVLEHGQYIMGPEVFELESRLAEFVGTKHCVSVSSGTDALLISLLALGIKQGDEVITTPFTYISTAEAIVSVGAKPVFVDIEKETCNINVQKIENAITEKTRAIIPVSLYGQPADMDEINEIAIRNGGLAVIEDAAQSFGAEYKGRKSCNLSTIGCTSFFPSKPLGCYGDGGAILTNDEALARAIREIRLHGQESRYHHTRIGVAGRMDTIQCGILLAKMEKFKWELDQRENIGRLYNSLFDELGVARVLQKQDRSSAFAQYTIFVRDRDRVELRLRDLGIPTAVHYPTPIDLQPAYKCYARPGYTDVARVLAKSVISLPFHPYMSDSTVKRIVEAVSSEV